MGFSSREQVMADWIRALDKLSLRDLTRLYKDLELNDKADLQGVYKGTYVGPRWLKTAAPTSLRLSSLGGWWGKLFKAGGETFNLVERDGALKPVIPMQLQALNSRLDGKPALVLVYDKRNPFPWPYIVDELRPLDETAVLGMMYLNINALPTIAFPFLLQAHEPVYGL